ncbi:SIR2 family protein [Promicromonospora sp. AC04]|uniref:SIR2 family protein n=1 Tax=Promicromonospora sp. AC04 TaxID=2135723 RepID=UPI001304B102|nr:SIR2 family protein [Promicromonospora sp. AC04]
MMNGASAVQTEPVENQLQRPLGSSFDPVLTLASILDATPGSHAVLLGAGVSISAKVPSAWGVQEELIRRVARAEGVMDEISEPHEWYQNQHGVEATYESLLETLAPTQHARQALLREFFEPETLNADHEAPQPSGAHKALARLAKSNQLRVFLTLNFDHLMEKALRDEGIEPVVARSVEDLSGLAPLHTLRAVVVHLHGDYLTPTAMRNTTTELAVYDDGLRAFLKNVLNDYALLAVGWSAEYDVALRAVLDADLLERYPSYWFDLAELKQKATDLANRRRFVQVRGPADETVGRLADAVDAIADRQARHPLSVTEAVAATKRDLGKRQVAISTHDRLRTELTRLQENPDLSRPINELESVPLGQIVDRLTEAALVPAALVASAAYWGDDSTDHWWFDDLRRLSLDRSDGGSDQLLKLPRLCGTLLFQAALVASVAARRFELSLQLLRASSERETPDGATLGHQLLAARGFAGRNTPSAEALEVLKPIFVEHLAFGARAYEEAWELADILAMVNDLLTIPEIASLRSSLESKRRDLANARGDMMHANEGPARTHAAQNVREVEEDEGLALSAIADRVNPVGVHVRSRQPIDKPVAAPTVERLLSDVRRAPNQHPLVVAGIGNADNLGAALEAVSLAVGRLGCQRAEQSMLAQHGRGNTIPISRLPRYIWVDTAEKPKF